jgi:hypothetical protein
MNVKDKREGEIYVNSIGCVFVDIDKYEMDMNIWMSVGFVNMIYIIAGYEFQGII